MTTEGMKLFLEGITDACEIIEEQSEDGSSKDFYIQGIFAQAGKKNKNGRIYSTPILNEAVNDYVKTFVVTNRAVGELGHPATPLVNYDRVSHIITEMVKEGDNFIGKARILSTPMGEIVKTFIKEGVQLSVSTRGLGRVQRDGDVSLVGPGFRLTAVDIVADPSGPECFVQGLMEGSSFVFDAASGNWIAEQVVEEAVEEIRRSKSVDDKQIARIINSFVVSLAKPNYGNS